MITSIEQIIQKAIELPQQRMAVAAAEGEHVIWAVNEARKRGITEPILIGDEKKICGLLEKEGASPADFEIIGTQSELESAAKAVSLAREGSVNCIMKGVINTSDMMRAVINRETGIRTDRLISHSMLYVMDSYYKLLLMTDGAMNIAPSFEQKLQILENAGFIMKSLGYEHINVSLICGSEVINPKVASMVEAAQMASMTDRWEAQGMSVIGPVALDLAVSPEACEIKHFEAPGAGDADVILVPNYEVGNGIGKSMTLFGRAENVGVMIGAKVPVVLSSRSDSAYSKLGSIALGCITGSAMRRENA